jgi:hypothetical protein
VDVGVREVGDGVGGAARVEEPEPGDEVREARRGRAGEPLGDGGEALGRRGPAVASAASRSAASAVSSGLRPEAPLRPGRHRRGATSKPRLAIKTAAPPYMGPRAVGSPPARMRTSSSWK